MDEKQKTKFGEELAKLEELYCLSSPNIFRNGPQVGQVIMTAGLREALTLLCRILLSMAKEE